MCRKVWGQTPGGIYSPCTLSTAKQRVESIIGFTADFKSIVKSRHDFTIKSSALDLRLILLSNQLIDLTRFFTVKYRARTCVGVGGH